MKYLLQEYLSSLTTLMGGSSHADLTRVTTRLVAGQVGTTKYHVSSCDGTVTLIAHTMQ